MIHFYLWSTKEPYSHLKEKSLTLCLDFWEDEGERRKKKKKKEIRLLFAFFYPKFKRVVSLPNEGKLLFCLFLCATFNIIRIFFVIFFFFCNKWCIIANWFCQWLNTLYAKLAISAFVDAMNLISIVWSPTDQLILSVPIYGDPIS